MQLFYFMDMEVMVKDISMLSLNWKRTYAKYNLSFVQMVMNQCSINPSGYQWFDLTKDDPNYILEESIKAEKNFK